MANIRKKRWEKMEKKNIPLSSLVDQYIVTCRTEGKTPNTLRGYGEKLRRFLKWCGDSTMDSFSVEMARGYISYLQTVTRYDGHPFKPNEEGGMSSANVRNHVRVLRSFSSWLEREEYTAVNVLGRLKVPKADRKVIETLSDAELGQLFRIMDINSDTGCRDASILLLVLDTGVRCSELLGIHIEDIHLEEQWLKVMGKGRKERVVPFGSKATRLLQRYIYHFRPEALDSSQLFLCVDSSPLSDNALHLLFKRLAARSGITRLHPHLLRHTFATRYLMSGGDAFSLQQILGHTTLEMTRRYTDMVALENAVRRKRLSPMDGNPAIHTRVKGKKWGSGAVFRGLG